MTGGIDWLVRVAWTALAALHLAPAAVLFAPTLVRRLYGVAPDGDVGILVIHRGALFLAVALAAAWGALDAAVRPLAATLVAVSMVGFLFVYVRAGMPPGALRPIAVADAVGLIPLAFVATMA